MRRLYEKKEIVMKSRIFAHSDLDGVVSAIVMHKYLMQKYPNELDHDIKITYESYESINPSFAEIVDHQDEYQEILIGDISINEELAHKCKPNVFIGDHHETAVHLREMNNPRFIYEPGMCGAAVCYKHLLGGKITPEFKKLLGLTNTYDLWNLKKGDLLPLELNIIVNKLKMKEAFQRFYNGFDGFSKSERAAIDEFWKIQDHMFDIVEKTVIGEGRHLMRITENPDAGFFDMNYWSHILMTEHGFKCILIERPSKLRWSVRLRKDLAEKFHLGFWLKENVKNIHNSAGGHKAAAGCSYEGLTGDEIADILEGLYNQLKDLE